MDEPAQKRAGGDYNRRRPHLPAIGQHQSGDTIAVNHQIMRLCFNDGEARLILDRRLHGTAIERPVGLRPWPPHGRALAAVEDAKLDTGLVGDTSHQPIHGIDFPDQMPLAEAADRRIAGHFAYRREAVRHQRCPGAGPRRRGRRLATRVAAADNNHIIGQSFAHAGRLPGLPGQVKRIPQHCFT